MRRNFHHVNSNDCNRARELRKASSTVEQKLWTALQKATSKTKIKFRRQQPIHPYIADFACMKAKLLVEVDGLSHDMQAVYDQKREAYLQAQGYTVLRISNDEVIKNITGVVNAIVRQAESSIAERHPLTSKN